MDLENHRNKCRLCFKYISKPWNSVNINENLVDIFFESLTNMKVKLLKSFFCSSRLNFTFLAFKNREVLFVGLQAMF